MPHKFPELFLALTETTPFPWQQALYERFIQDCPGNIPPVVEVQTGLGKTSVVAIWLCALLTHPARMPRRLVYVVNRRTVVDQTTGDVVRLRERLHNSRALEAKLFAMSAIPPISPSDSPLAISTLRGQFADNREWCADPARPAVIVGTVDMIGSGLLFNRYTCGFKTRPHHAALLGQDVLLVHDEAHLEPAFQELLLKLADEQKRCREAHPLRVLALSATTRDTAAPFTLTEEDKKDDRVKKRLHAAKRLVFHPPVADEKKQLADRLAELALARRESGRAVLVFARSVEVIQRVAEALGKEKLKKAALTGTMRGKERDELVQNETFLRFLPPSSTPDNSPQPAEGTVYLIATSAGEVGVNISADDLICDLSTYESMAQRFGRVNRFGCASNSVIEVVYSEAFKEDHPLDEARARTLALLRRLEGDASPAALGELNPAERAAAFSPPPEIRPVTDILLDAWAMTSIREALPGRPPVAPYLHGEPQEWEPPDTYVAWRQEVDVIKGPLLESYKPEKLAELLDDYPLKPHELLRDQSRRVREELAQIWGRISGNLGGNPEPNVWIINEAGSIKLKPLSEFKELESEPELHGRTILLPPSVGGLADGGFLNGSADRPDNGSCDVADMPGLRQRFLHSTPKVPDEFSGFRLNRSIDTWRGSEESADLEASNKNRYWLWLEKPALQDKGGIRKAEESIPLEDHTRDVAGHASAIAKKLNLSESLAECLVLAARFHDLGKRRRYWQRGIGNRDSQVCYAKAGRELCPRGLEEPYRHEFGSVRDAALEKEFKERTPDEKDLVLHLIAAHHGRARPHFSTDEAFDPEAALEDVEEIASEVPRRFARLQRRFGRWGLAYLESLLRAADYAASAGIAPKGPMP